MCINRRSLPTAPGSISSAAPGCSTPAFNLAARRCISCSISTTVPPSGCRSATSNTSTSMRRCSGRPRRSPIPRSGSYPWVGLPIRAWRYRYRRQVDHGLQNLADHREVIAVAGILLHDVGKIGGRNIEPLGQQPRDQQRHRRLVAQKRCGIADLVDGRIGRRAHGGGMGLIEQHRHFAQHGAGLGDDGDDGIAFDDFKPSLDQHVEVSGGAAFMDDERSRRNAALNSPGAIVQNRAHSATLPALDSKGWGKIRQQGCDRRTDNVFDLLKLFAPTRGRRAPYAASFGSVLRRPAPDNSGPNEMANPKKAAAQANAARCSNGSLWAGSITAQMRAKAATIIAA